MRPLGLTLCALVNLEIRILSQRSLFRPSQNMLDLNGVVENLDSKVAVLPDDMLQCPWHLVVHSLVRNQTIFNPMNRAIALLHPHVHDMDCPEEHCLSRHE